MMSGSIKEIYLAGGCFWGMQKFIDQFEGVIETEVGYANGPATQPSYEEVCKSSGHAETVRIAYDPGKISLRELLDFYFTVIDPVSVNRQGNDIGIQYRTGIYYTDSADIPVIDLACRAVKEKTGGKFAVEVCPLEYFWPAEEYHQKYLDKNPGGYCHIPARFFNIAGEQGRSDAYRKNGIVVIGATFVDIKGYPFGQYIPAGRNAGRVVEVHGGVSRNIAEDIANVELKPTYITVLDEGGISDDVVRKLDKHRCNTEYIRRTEGGLGTWLAVFDNSGDVVASISKRPDLSEIQNILSEQGDEIFSNADSIAVEFDVEAPLLKQILALAEKYGKKVYAPVSNMSIAVERRDLMRYISCIVCNLQEAGILFSEDFEGISPEEMTEIIYDKITTAEIPGIVVTMGSQGAVYANLSGERGFCPARKVDVNDTTGCGDAFFAGLAIGLTYGKTFGEACEIGTRLASSVIVTDENVCPRFRPAEFGLDVAK